MDFEERVEISRSVGHSIIFFCKWLLFNFCFLSLVQALSLACSTFINNMIIDI